ncbi:MAG: hypothetical protein KDD67_07025 [Ignavibacteriae bacterium]|nr:hypothetical protein [Ignavibacteriota bacterium]MCB9215229.1 hypothetical protein [Ignavibacteria bacterium]
MKLSNTCGWTASLALTFIVCWTTTTLTLQAQQWQYVYGGDNTSEDGFRGVTPVTGLCRSTPSCTSCSTQTDGYIAVGTSYDPSTNDDLYVVRTDNNGAAIWEITYDISGHGSNDEGRSIIELSDGSGFVVVGNTYTSPNLEAFLMKIDCDGNVLWTQTYRGPLVDNATGVTGMDVIEATTGDASQGTSAGDLVVTGTVAIGTISFEDGLIFRTTSTGTLIWNTHYNTGAGTSDRLYALIEATPLPGVRTGDLIAAGNQVQQGNYQAYVLRVDGNNGSVNNLPGLLQGAALYGGAAPFADRFFSLVELQNPAQTGTNGQPNVVLAGHGDATAGGTEIFLVKLDDGDPCTPLAQRLIGDGDPITPEVDIAYDIKEVTVGFSQGTISRWDLVLTGLSSMVTGGTNNDAMLLGINPGTLAPIAGGGQVYRPTTVANNSDQGWSLAIVDAVGGRTQGVVMCGGTRSDWMSVSDFQDMYFLKTNTSLSTGLTCEAAYNPQSVTVTGVECIDPTWSSTLTQSAVTPDDASHDWGDPVCGGSPIKAIPGIAEESTKMLTLPYEVRLTPNRLHTGENLRLLFKGEELPEMVQVGVVNSLGERLKESSWMGLGVGEIALSTSEWPAGVYFVTVDDGTYRQMIRVVFVE